MKKENYPLLALAFIFIFSMGVIAGRYDQANRPKYGALRTEVKKAPWDMPYSIHILDEHEVQLISKMDTVTLLMENATSMSDEWCIFVKK